MPAAAQTVHTVAMKPGDRVSASVTVSGHDVTFHVRNLTTGGSFSTTKRVSSPDVSSADWIAEAPSSCARSNDCRTLPLSNFGSVRFTHASATTPKGKTGAISSSRWTTTKITLGQTSRRFSHLGAVSAPDDNGGQPVTFPGGAALVS